MVNGNGCSTGLNKVNRFIGIDVKTLPINRQIVATLVDGSGICTVANTSLASSHLPATGACLSGGGQHCRHC